MEKKRPYDHLLFPVRKVEADTITNMPILATRHSHANVMTDDDGNDQIIAFVGEGYQLVKNEDLLKPLDAFLTDNYEVEMKTQHSNYSRFSTTFIIKNKGQEIIQGDTIFPMIKVQNSYDGRLKLNIQLGFHRLVCSNGMTAPIGELRKVAGIHTASITELVNQFLNTVEDFLAEAHEHMKTYNPLIEKEIDEVILQETIEAAIKGTKFPKRQIEDAVDIMRYESDTLKQPMSAWLIYNGLNSIIYDEDGGMDITKADEADAKILDNLLELS